MAPWLATVKLHPAPAHGFKGGEGGSVSNEKLVMGSADPVTETSAARQNSETPWVNIPTIIFISSEIQICLQNSSRCRSLNVRMLFTNSLLPDKRNSSSFFSRGSEKKLDGRVCARKPNRESDGRLTVNWRDSRYGNYLKKGGPSFINL
jgi:hypothetical protein